MLLSECLDLKLLFQMMDEGYVREQSHPEFPSLRILNYTEKAQFDNKWNDVTEKCRGLIFDTNTNKVVSRPFRKFFNYGQPGCPEIDMSAQAIVTDKMDGSLGILYKRPDGMFAIATRGSFSSDQAIHATRVLNEKYSGWLKARVYSFKEFTPIFEILYPENRIVCNYGDMDDLVLLGMVDIESDYTWSAETAQDFFNWEGPVAETFTYETMAEALAAQPRPGKEGFVVFFPDTDDRVKIKQEDYIALHRIVTGLNARTVWQSLSQKIPFRDLIENLPDEFHPWVTKTWDDLCDKYDNILDQIDEEYELAISLTEQAMGDKFDTATHRKIFAKYAKDSPFAGFLFSKLDQKNYSNKVWELIRPGANITPSGKTVTEDNS